MALQEGSTMATMAIDVPHYPAPLMPLEREWTVRDLEALPDDGLRYELIDGGLVVTPAPTPTHQSTVVGLIVALHAACPADLKVFVSPIDFQPHRRLSLQPDVLVTRRSAVGRTSISEALLVVEVLSPSTRRRDVIYKRSVYEDCGVVSYWMFEPEVPSLVVCELVDGRYMEAAKVIGREEVHVERPYPVRLCPAELAEG
jgi:Uma2 family endonuclease